MNNTIARILAALTIPICAVTADAQSPLRPRWTLTGGLALNNHVADFRALPGVPNCCPRFENGAGTGPMFGLGYETPLGDGLLLSFGVGYMDHAALLSEREAVAVIAGGELRAGAFEHTIDASIASVGLEAGARYRVAEGLFLRGGLRAGVPLSPRYAQREQLVEPAATGTFLDSLGRDSGSRTRNENSGDLPDASTILLHAVAGAEYELPLNDSRTVLLAPGVSYALGLTDVVAGRTWKPNALAFSLTLKYSPMPARDVLRDTVWLRDTVVVTVARDAAPALRLGLREVRTERADGGAYDIERVTIVERYERETPKPVTLRSSLVAVGLDDGREEPVATLRVEEFLRTNAHPVLGYVFFGAGSAEIPSRYARMSRADAGAFRPEQLFGEDAMGIAHNVLNIVGQNMRQYPNARLSITGCNAGPSAETGGRGLSLARAEAIKRYLVEVWAIDADRLDVSERDLPAVPSNTATAEGAEENRRAEITSDVPEVTDAFIAHDTTRTASPPALRFKPSVASSGDPVASWRIVVRQRGEILKEFTGTGAPPAAVDWELTERGGLPRFSEPLAVQLEAVTVAGERTISDATLPTDVVTVQRKRDEGARDFRVEQYNLVLFDVGRSDITAAHARTIELVRSRLAPGSAIMVEGFTDRSGDADANRRLARLRAVATEAALGRRGTVKGIGEDRLLYDNATPEGRFYCRTVRITVKTPVR